MEFITRWQRESYARVRIRADFVELKLCIDAIVGFVRPYAVSHTAEPISCAQAHKEESP